MPDYSRAVKPSKFWVPLLLVLGSVLGTTSQLQACSVPVFRYALEHWRSDPFQVLFYHRGELTKDQQALVKQFSRDGQAGKISANVEVIPIDVDQLDPANPRSKVDLEIWEEQNTITLPWMVVQYPLSSRIPTTIWAGEPTKAASELLLDSPKRQLICERIVKGDTAVWVLLESGDKKADDLAYQRLRNELKKCEKELELPAPDPQDVADGLINVDQATLKIQFSIVRLSRTDAKEGPFVNMLLDSEPGLREKEFEGKPMAFPIFGRGRALYALIGDGIKYEVIHDACRFLVGPCSCQVKQQNPGADLLMAMNWDQAVTPQIKVDNSLPPLPVFSADPNPEDPKVPVAQGSDPKPATNTETKPEPAQATNGNKPHPAAETSKAKPVSATVKNPAANSKPVPANSQAALESGGGKVMTTLMICLGIAVAGIAAMSVFLVKS